MARVDRGRGAAPWLAAPWLAAVVAVLVASTVLVPPVAAERSPGSGPGPSDATLHEPGKLSSILQPVSGVRDGAPTIIGGAVVNGTDDAVEATVRIETPGVVVGTARPSPAAPRDGTAWSCRSTECRLVDVEGRPVRLTAQTATEVMLALTGPGVVAGASVRVRVGGLEPVDVPLDRADGAAPLGARTIGLVALGAEQLVAGSPSTTELQVTNLGIDPVDPGSLAVSAPFPAGDGPVVTARGDGWTCDPSGACTFDGSVGPLDTAAPLQLTITAPAGAPADSRLATTVAATATSGGAEVRATSELSFSVVEPTAVDVAVQLDLEHPTISAPDSQVLLGGVTALGTGPYPGPVVVQLHADEHIRIAWDRAGPPGRWDCDAATESCRATQPITADAVTPIELPLDVDAAIEPGMYDLTLRADLPLAEGSDEERPSRENTQTLVVNPPPVAELRAALAAPGSDPSDGALELHGGSAAPVDVVVTNQGTRAARAGTEVHVELRPDGARVAPVPADDDWACTPGEDRSVDTRRPLRCTTTLRADIAPGASVRVPLSFDATEPGTTTWNVRSGAGAEPADASSTDAEVVVVADGPVLSPMAQVTSKIVRHGTGALEVSAENRGRGAADGGVVVIDMTEDLTILDASGAGWNCLHAGFRGSNGSLTCATHETVEPGASTSPLRVELAATTDRSEASVWLWSTTGGQAHPRSDRTGRSVEIDLRGTAVLDAGADRTVISPTRSADGSWQAASVTLHGAVDMASGHRMRWTQAGGPAVRWHGGDGDGGPTSPTATFTAPTLDGAAAEPVELTFRLVADYDGRSVSDDVVIRLVPPGSEARSETSNEIDRTKGPGPTDPTVVVDLGDPVADVPDRSTGAESTAAPTTAAPTTAAPTTAAPTTAAPTTRPAGSTGLRRQVRVGSGAGSGPSLRPGRPVARLLGASLERAARQAIGAVPDQLCRAAAALAAGSHATVDGAAGAIVLWLPAGTTAPRGACGQSTSIDVTGATLSLPGGASIAIDGGVLDRNGLQIRNGEVSPPASWTMPVARVPAGGLTLPFETLPFETLPTDTLPAEIPPADTLPDVDAPAGDAVAGTVPAELSAASLTVQLSGLPASLAAKGSTSLTFGAEGTAELRGRSDDPAIVVSGRAARRHAAARCPPHRNRPPGRSRRPRLGCRVRRGRRHRHRVRLDAARVARRPDPARRRRHPHHGGGAVGPRPSDRHRHHRHRRPGPGHRERRAGGHRGRRSRRHLGRPGHRRLTLVALG